MIIIKDHIRRIRKGDLQYFMPIVESNIDYIYALCSEKYGTSESERITTDIFMRLYKGIMGFIMFRNPETLIDKLLKKACKKYNLKYLNPKSGISNKAPDIVMRKLLMKLSTTSKRKNTLSTVTICSICCVSILTVIIALSSFVKTNYTVERTLITDNISPTLIYNESFNDNSVEIKGISSLGNKGMAIDTYFENGKHSVYLWSEGELIQTINVTNDLKFLAGNMKSDSYIFKDNSKIYRINSYGEKLSSIKLSGQFLDSSPNRRYIVLQDSDSSIIVLDTVGMNIVSEVYGKYFAINDNGVVIYNNDTKSIVPNLHLKNSKVIRAALDDSGSTTVIYSDGIVEKYKDEELEWKNYVSIPTDNDDQSLNSIQNAHILCGDDKIIVVVEYADGVIFQTFNTVDGSKMVRTYETMHTGVAMPEPKLSSDGRVLLLSSKIQDENISVRYNGVIDTKTMPMKEVKLQSDEKLLFVNIESTKDHYFIYQLSESANLEISQISIND